MQLEGPSVCCGACGDRACAPQTSVYTSTHSGIQHDGRRHTLHADRNQAISPDDCALVRTDRSPLYVVHTMSATPRLAAILQLAVHPDRIHWSGTISTQPSECACVVW